MKPARTVLTLKLDQDRFDKLKTLSNAFRVTHKMAAAECIDAAYDLYMQALNQAAQQHLKESKDGQEEVAG